MIIVWHLNITISLTDINLGAVIGFIVLATALACIGFYFYNKKDSFNKEEFKSAVSTVVYVLVVSVKAIREISNIFK